MNVVVSVAAHEIEMAHRWMDWVLELGGTEGHHLFLIPAADAKVQDIIPKANKAFGGRVSIIKDEEGETSDWQVTEALRSAAGPNSAFRQVAWHFFHKRLGPYFWCELDCIPMTIGWLDRLESEYRSCGKPFMGARVQIESVPEHMSGNAVYPTDIPIQAPTLIMRTEWTPKEQTKSFELAFDIAGAREVIPQAFWTNLIQHKFRYEGFKSRAEFDAVIDPNAVVFHSDKKGTIYQYLRENLGGVPVPAEATSQVDESLRCVESKVEAQEGNGIPLTRQNSSDYSDAAQTPSRDDLVRDAVAVLKSLCTSPRATNLVRKELKRQKVVTKI